MDAVVLFIFYTSVIFLKKIILDFFLNLSNIYVNLFELSIFVTLQ